MNKAISTPIAIIIVLIVFTISIGLILLGYLYIPKPKYEPVSEEIEEMDISNWETYRNEEYGFEIKYPKEAEVSKSLPDVPLGLNEITLLYIILDDYMVKIAGPYEASDVYGGNPELEKNVIITKTIINNNKVLIREKITKTSAFVYYSKSATIQGLNYNFLVNIQEMYDINSDYQSKIKEQEKEFDRILSTFKFIEGEKSSEEVENIYKVDIKRLNKENIEILSYYLEDLFNLSHRAIYKIIYDVREIKGVDEGFLFDDSNYHALYIFSYQEIKLGSYENELATVNVENIDKHIIPYLKDFDYCRVKDDCSIRGLKCDQGAFNYYEWWEEGRGCETPGFPEENEESLYDFCGEGKQPWVEYNDFDCIDNECIAKGRTIHCNSY